MTISCTKILREGASQSIGTRPSRPTTAGAALGTRRSGCGERKLQSLLPRKLSGIDARHRERLRGHLRRAPRPRRSSVSSSRLKPERDEAHDEEAHRLEVRAGRRARRRSSGGSARSCWPPRPATRAPRRRGSRARSHARTARTRARLTTKPMPPTSAEADELQPVGGVAHTVQEPHVGAQLDEACLVVHAAQVSGSMGERCR